MPGGPRRCWIERQLHIPAFSEFRKRGSSVRSEGISRNTLHDPKSAGRLRSFFRGVFFTCNRTFSFFLNRDLRLQHVFCRRSRSWSDTAHTSHEIKKLGNLKGFAGMPADFPNKNSGSLFQSLQICNRVALVGKNLPGADYRRPRSTRQRHVCLRGRFSRRKMRP
jgi:hypothetical protein